MQDLLEKILCCPGCRQDLKRDYASLVCVNCKQEYKVEDGIVKIIPNLTDDLKFSIEKWDEMYRKQLDMLSFYKEYENYKKLYHQNIYNQLKNEKDFENITYLEIGCGQFFLGLDIAKECDLIIGIDICPSALKIAKRMMEERGVENYILIQGDILNLPIKNDIADLVFGGGVIEHFKGTQKCVNELHRVLRKDGISFNAVPYLNIGSLTYRQVWGNIPNVPFIREIYEFVHIKLLGGKHMIFGYEMSFLGTTLNKIHKKAGFRDIKIKKLKVTLSFDFMPKSLKKYCIWLSENSRLFWPMVKVIAKK
jgi:ubiquinone/menaquinone biosynthesis C-methylase UbiE/uncharacterized protein YbaR (Trm112 family)